ncbi:MAG: hypothetical protein AMXMBFR47_16940 [Planctomycetota bacterium]
MSGSTLTVCLVLSAWFVAAALAGREGWLAAHPRPLIPCISLGMAALALLAAHAVPSVRRLMGSLPLRLLIGLHSVRLMGVAFFVVYGRMQIPGVFALPAGGCEIAVAISAMAIALAPLGPPRRLQLARLWNYAGLAELSALVIGGLIFAFGEPARSMSLARPPLSLFLTFVVPLALTTHVLLTRRLGTFDSTPRVSGRR